MPWIEIKEGCKMPDYDEPVEWATEDGNYFIDAIDKDDPAWWNGEPMDGGRSWRLKCTHWRKIIGPSEELNQDILWDEFNKEVANNSLNGPLLDYTILRLKRLYTIIRKLS